MNSESTSVPKISFCTVSFNRLHHLKHTLPKNIAIASNASLVEFIILDHKSEDGLDLWIQSQMHDQIESGLLVFAQLRDNVRFHRSHAKNMAHRLARGEIVCNLDADNFLNIRFVEYLRHQFERSSSIFVRGRGDSLPGRLALQREDFLRLGGYDECMVYGWGHEDTDLANRAKAWGLQPKLCQQCGQAIQHGDDERTQNSLFRDKVTSRRLHTAISRTNLQRGELIANKNVHWGAGNILINYKKEFSI